MPQNVIISEFTVLLEILIAVGVSLALMTSAM